jgi:hypothetical protein
MERGRAMNFDLKNRQYLLLLIALVMVGLFLGDRFVRAPLVNAWRTRSDRLAQLRMDVHRGDMLMERADALQATWDRMLTNALPADAPVAESRMLRAFDRWSQTSGVSVSSVRPQWRRAGDDYVTLECRAEISGDLERVTRLLYEIEHDSMGIKVDSADIATRDTDGAHITLGLQVSGLQFVPTTQ